METLNISWLHIIGFFGQFCFFSRFLIQWFYTEKMKKVVVPTSFWLISIVGAICLMVYSIGKEDIVFFSGSILSLVIYFRNYYIARGAKSEF